MTRLRPTLVAILAVVGIGVLALPAAASAKGFKSPSKNIYCQAFQTPWSLRCDILQHTYKAPKRPASCDLEWGDSLGLSRRSTSHWVCHGDTVMDPSLVTLAYGKTWKWGPFACTSRTTGVTCTNQTHGFRLSRASFLRFKKATSAT